MNDHNISIFTHFDTNLNMSQNFTVDFFSTYITTTVTATPSVVKNWLCRVLYLHHSHRHKLVVGLGVQWNPHSSDYNPSAATLQLCIGRQCLIFQLRHANSVPSSLRRFLADPRTTFVGVRNNRDKAMLLASEHRLEIANLVDACHIAADIYLISPHISMEDLARIVLGFEGVTKPEWIGRSGWDVYWLSPEQVQYACVDAYLSFQLGKALQVWNRG